MKMFKRFLALMLVGVMLLSLASCGSDALVVGITNFAPMDYEENGEWVGYDAELAKMFAEYLDKDVEFVEIEWDYKADELENGNIDVVWNGMTLTDEVKAAMDCSNAYLRNAQVVVMPSAEAAKYKDAASMKDLIFAVENGSAGEEMADANKFNKTEVADQATALMEVKSGSSDAAIIDLLMAGAMIGEGTDYADLTVVIELNSEVYGIGFAKDSELVEKCNEFLVEAYKDGTMEKLAKKYGISTDAILEQKAEK